MSYDCEHKPKCVNYRHHVQRFYSEPRPQIGQAPTLRQRMQSALGEKLWRAGVTLHWVWLSRLGWDLQTLSWGKGFTCMCGKRSRTERQHLTHECSTFPLEHDV